MADGRERLRANSYPGRGIILGLDASGRFAVQIYWITARSAGSKNRVLLIEDGDVRTRPFDEAGRSDDPNIYYRAIASAGDRHVVSNGNHTDVIVEHLAGGRAFEDAMRTQTYEDDPPNFTPRIAGLMDLSATRPAAYFASAVKGSTVDTLHSVYTYGMLQPGLGYCLHTYVGDGNPLPSFTERPYEFELRGTPEHAATDVWDLLPADKRVALALKAIDVQTKRVVTLTVRNTLG
jgi:IMP cyclohydrolase